MNKIITLRRKQTLEEILAKKEAKELLYQFINDSTFECDDIEDPDEYWGMVIYHILMHCRDEVNSKVTARAVKAFSKKQWALRG